MTHTGCVVVVELDVEVVAVGFVLDEVVVLEVVDVLDVVDVEELEEVLAVVVVVVEEVVVAVG